MSFLNSVLSSIKTGKPSSLSPSVPSRPPPQRTLATEAKHEAQKALSSGSEKTGIPLRSGNVPVAGSKRKADEALSPADRPKPKSADKPSGLTSGAKSPGVIKSSALNGTAATKPAASVAPSKPPPKGSYADLMMKAKALQGQKPSQVGLLKHQAVPKEKLSKAEKKRRAMEAIAKEKAARLEKRKGTNSASNSSAKPGVKLDNNTTIKRREPEENAYKGTSRPTSSPHKGSTNTRSSHAPSDARRTRPSKRDEYLATDEEDEGDYYGNDDNDYYSDESSDMEAGLMDVEREEEAALRAALHEDDEDIRAETLAKKQKMERKKRLAALAARKH